MKKYCYLLFIAAALVSCRKPEPVSPPKQNEFFLNAGLVNFQRYRMFTHSGEITADSIINRYVTQFQVHFFAPGHTLSDPDFQKFAVASPDSVLNVSRAPVIQAKRTISGMYDVYNSGGMVFLSDTADIHFQLLTYKTFHVRAQNPGFGYFEWEAPVYTLKRRGDSLLFPIAKYLIISRSDFVTAFRSDHFNNIFNMEGTKKLSLKDTLLVQQFELAMIKGSE